LKTAFILSTALSTTLESYPNADRRRAQYLFGIKRVLASLASRTDMDIFIADNTITDETKLDEHLKEQLKLIDPGNKYYFLDNEYGALNKGCGLLSQWGNILPALVDTYKYMIHYEPRQIMKNENFLKKYERCPANIFKQDDIQIYSYKIFPIMYSHFQTGFFSCNTRTLLEFVLQNSQEEMVKDKKSIEELIYFYFKKKGIHFEKIDNLGLIWDSGKAWIDI